MSAETIQVSGYINIERTEAGRLTLKGPTQRPSQGMRVVASFLLKVVVQAAALRPVTGTIEIAIPAEMVRTIVETEVANLAVLAGRAEGVSEDEAP